MSTLGVCIGFLTLGVLSDALFKPYIAVNHLAGILHKVIPNLGYFFQVDALNLNRAIPVGYLLGAGAYAVCCCLNATHRLAHSRCLIAEGREFVGPPKIHA